MNADEENRMRERLKAIGKLNERVFDKGAYCPHCDGSGFVPVRRLLVHDSLEDIGTDLSIRTAGREILEADDARWTTNLLGEVLAVTTDGRTRYYDVKDVE